MLLDQLQSFKGERGLAAVGGSGDKQEANHYLNFLEW